MKPKTAPKPLTAADVARGLHPDLEKIAECVPPHRYGYATAREFAVGDFSGKSRRPRYAKT